MFDIIFKPKKISLSNGKTVIQKRSRTPLILIAVALFIIISYNATDFSFEVLFKKGYQFFVIIWEMIPPRWEYIPDIWGPLMDTIKMSLFGSLIGALVAIPAAVLASSNIIKSKIIVFLGKVFLSVLRTLPTLVSALIATFIFGLGTMAGTVAIFLFTVAYVGKLLYEQIENADMGPFEAMEAAGMTRLQAFRHAVFPQVFPNFLSTSLFAFEGNVRYAAILGYVGAGGVGLLLDETIGWRDYASTGMILFVLVITVFLIERVSEHFRKRLI